MTDEILSTAEFSTKVGFATVEEFFAALTAEVRRFLSTEGNRLHNMNGPDLVSTKEGIMEFDWNNTGDKKLVSDLEAAVRRQFAGFEIAADWDWADLLNWFIYDPS